MSRQHLIITVLFLWTLALSGCGDNVTGADKYPEIYEDHLHSQEIDISVPRQGDISLHIPSHRQYCLGFRWLNQNGHDIYSGGDSQSLPVKIRATVSDGKYVHIFRHDTEVLGASPSMTAEMFGYAIYEPVIELFRDIPSGEKVTISWRIEAGNDSPPPKVQVIVHSQFTGSL